MSTLTNVLVQAAQRDAKGLMRIDLRLASLGACENAIEWVKKRKVQTPQALWTHPSSNPHYMLWLLRRTCHSYKSKKIRKLAACMAELFPMQLSKAVPITEGESQALEHLQKFADGKVQSEALRHMCEQTPSKTGRVYNILSVFSPGRCGIDLDWFARVYQCEAHTKANNINLFFKESEFRDACAVILKHFPKAPRLP